MKFLPWIIYHQLRRHHSSRRDEVMRRYSRQYWARTDSLIKFGVYATAIFFIVIIFLSFGTACVNGSCGRRIFLFMRSPANEIGDALAGLAGGLAFLWLIVTVLLQSKELSAQRDELKLTRQEFQKMSESQKKQVELLRVQGEIFEEEQKQRLQSYAEKQLLEHLELLANDIIECIDQTSRNQLRLRAIFGRMDPKQRDRALIKSLSINSKYYIDAVEGERDTHHTHLGPPEKNTISRITEILEDILKYKEIAGASKRKLTEQLLVQQSYENMSKILNEFYFYEK